MRVLRGGSGLGDSMYLVPIVRELSRNERLVVRTNYPELFTGLNVRCEPFKRDGADIVAHYSLGKYDVRTTQYEDMCRSAKLTIFPSLDMPSWQVRNNYLVRHVRDQAGGAPIVLVHGGRTPMARTDGFGAELLPKRAAFDSVLKQQTRCFTVLIGKAPQCYPLKTDLDLSGKTSITDLLDLMSIADGAIGQCSFIVPLAELFDKPLLVVWSAEGLASKEQFIRAITPGKVLHKTSSGYVLDSWHASRLALESELFIQRLFTVEEDAAA